MRPTARMALAATCCTLVFASACSDSTSPNDSQDAAHLAAHFDSLYVDAAAHAETSSGFADRATILSLLELGPALGATATNVTVTTANGSEHWKGFELEDVASSGGTLNDTTYFVVAYREAAAHTVMLALYDSTGLARAGTIITNDTLNIPASDGGGSTTLSSLGSACTALSPSLQNPDLTTITSLECNTANFNTSLSLVVPSTPNVDAALTALSFSTTAFSGVRIVMDESSGQAAVRRVRAMLRKAQGGNRL